MERRLCAESGFLKATSIFEGLFGRGGKSASRRLWQPGRFSVDLFVSYLGLWVTLWSLELAAGSGFKSVAPNALSLFLSLRLFKAGSTNCSELSATLRGNDLGVEWRARALAGRGISEVIQLASRSRDLLPGKRAVIVQPCF